MRTILTRDFRVPNPGLLGTSPGTSGYQAGTSGYHEHLLFITISAGKYTFFGNSDKSVKY